MSSAGSLEPWRSLTDSSARHAELPSTRAEQWRLAGELRELPPGAIVLLSGSTSAVRRRLAPVVKQARLEILARFLTIPSLEPPAHYVADTPSAARFFIDRILTIPRGGAAVSAALGAWKTTNRFGGHRALRLLARRRLIVTRTLDHRGGAQVPGTLLAVPGMDSVVLALSKDQNAKLTVLLLPHGESEPVVAAKVPTTDVASRVVGAERHVLETLRRGLPPDLAGTVPQVVAVAGAPGSVLTTAAMAGTPMSTSYHAWRHLASPPKVRGDFAIVERWLGSFQAATAGDVSECDFGAGLDSSIGQRFDDDANMASGLAALRAVSQRLADMRTPRTAVHGDFWFGNLLVEGGRISGVVDWESASPSGEPLRDVARFALSYSLYLDRHSRAGRPVSGHPGLAAGPWGAGITYAIDGQGWFPEAFRGFLQDSLKRLGGDPEAWRDVALAGLAEIAGTADHPEFARHHWELFKRLAA
jgi:phosphotransferase family enzyme